MAPRHAARAWAAASALVLIGAVSACMPEPGAAPSPSVSSSGSSAPTLTASPTATSSAAAIPADCREMLSAGVLEQLNDVALNDPGFGVTGAQADGSLICAWGDPAAGGAHLVTTMTYVSRGPALDMLNGLLAEGFACYTPDEGTRCEKTWFSEPDLVPQGRTLFWREDILIDSQFSDLAPSGYTAAIVAGVFE